MPNAALIEQARAAQQQRDGVAERNYAALVAELAAGVEVMPEDVLRIVEGAGHSLDNLNADIATEERRGELRRQLADEPALTAAVAQAQADHAAAEAKYESLVAAAQKAVAAKHQVLRQAIYERDQLNAVRTELLKLAGPAFHATRSQLLERRSEALRQREQSQHAAAEDAANVRSIEARLAALGPDGDEHERANLRADLERAKRYLSASERQHVAAVEAVESLDEQLAQLRTDALG